MKKVLLRYNQISHLPAEYQQQVRDLGDFYQQLPFDTDFVEAECDDLDQGFASMAALDPDWVVVVAHGHCTQDRGIYDQLIDHCVDTGAIMSAHILDFPDQYLHIHPQLFAINYRSWVALGCPSWNYVGGAGSFQSVCYVSSAEKFHDEYTPHWTKPGADTTSYDVREMQVGASVCRTLLEQGHIIHNIPSTIRSRKWHLYPDQSWEQFREFLSGGEYQGTNHSQKEYASLVGHLSNQVQKQYYVLNTEPLTRLSSAKPAHYAGVSSGLKLMCSMVKNGFDEDTAVTVFDFSDIALRFQRYLISEWDGDLGNYQVTCKRFEDSTPGHFPCLPSGSWEDSYQHLLTQLSLDRGSFKEAWQRYQRLVHRFETINLYDANDQHRLANICREHQSSYLWVSNAFYMEYSLVKLGKPKLKEIRQGLLDALTGSNTVLDINDHWHQGLITFDQ